MIQGAIIGQGIVERFPRLQFHTRFALISLLALFFAYSIVNVLRFAYPDKINAEVLNSITLDNVVSFTLKTIGIAPDLGAIVAVSITVSVILLLKLTGFKGYRSSFMLVLGIIMLIITLLVKFSDYQPNTIEIFLFILFHASLIVGLLFGTRRKLYSKEIKVRNFVNWWTGN